MYGGGRQQPENDVLRQVYVKQRQIELEEKFRSLWKYRKSGSIVNDDTVRRCADLASRLQTKHGFMEYPQKKDYINHLQKTIRQKKLETAKLREEIARRETDLMLRNHPAALKVTDVTVAAKMAENMFELYKGTWSSLYGDIRSKVPEKLADQTILGGLRDMMKVCYDTCVEMSRKQRLRMSDALVYDTPRGNMATSLDRQLQSCQRQTAPFTLAFIYKVIKTELATNYATLLKRLRLSPYKTPLVEFLERFTEFTWYSQVRVPPVAMEFSLLGETSVYEPFSNKGPAVDYVVWPVLYLFEGGPLLAKGVAVYTLGIRPHRVNDQL